MHKTKNLLRDEIKNYYYRGCGTTSPSLSKKMKIWLYQFGMHCVVVYRFGQYAGEVYAKNKLLGLLYKIIHRFLDYIIKFIYHVDIDAVNIEPGLYIGHTGTIIIGPCNIGKNFCVTHNVTIGIGHAMGIENIPTIGDNVWVGTGSVITGAISIGSRVTISSGSILSRDIPDGCLVGGNPARVLLRDYDNSKLIIEPPPD
ncbi:MAG: serine acetyltransferase [candidate division Zixibacteria bacterium]|nr:serine acetyltransferase [candidate division Zixibacteria bacterium]